MRLRTTSFSSNYDKLGASFSQLDGEEPRCVWRQRGLSICRGVLLTLFTSTPFQGSLHFESLSDHFECGFGVLAFLFGVVTEKFMQWDS